MRNAVSGAHTCAFTRVYACRHVYSSARELACVCVHNLRISLLCKDQEAPAAPGRAGVRPRPGAALTGVSPGSRVGALGQRVSVGEAR